MADCEHCGTTFSAKSTDDRFCCHGCEYVFSLIADHGFEQFYDLKQNAVVSPVRSRPFEEHDFSWLPNLVTQAESEAERFAREARIDLGLEGISCVGCVWLIEKIYSRHPGTKRAIANPTQGKLHLEWIPGQCDLEPFLRELCQFGYVALQNHHQPTGNERRSLGTRVGLCGAFALNTMAFSLPGYLGMPDQFEFAKLFILISFLSATLSMLVGASYFIDRAWTATRAKTLHLDHPIALGLIIAYIGSIIGWSLNDSKWLYFDFVSTFVFLMLTGRFLQTSAIDRNRRRLIRQQPVPEWLPRADQPTSWISRNQLEHGSRFLLAPGQALPVSSVITQGKADFSLEWIHGEADPIPFSEGSHLPAGAILLSRETLALTASEAWTNSLLAKLTADPIGERSAPGHERLLKIYIYVVLLIGGGTLLTWGWLGRDWIQGTQSMISIFIVSCPCALGVAIPLADDIAASRMAQLGVFVRNTTLWSRLRKVKEVVFDKTGTLTLERPQLQNPEAISQLNDEQALALARLTRSSLHPISRSLLESLGRRGQQLLATHGDSSTCEHPGLGVTLEDSPRFWSLGKAGWDGKILEPHPSSNATTEFRMDGQIIAALMFRESLRPDAVKTIDHLKSQGLSLHILSGDHPDKVSHVADLLGIPHQQTLGGLSPVDKASEVTRIGSNRSLYLGDGANDSLAFDAALVTGTPVVDRSLLESKSDFYTFTSGLSFLPKLFAIAQARAKATIFAFVFALLYNVSAIYLSASGLMKPWVAAIIMPLSSIISILIVFGVFQLNSRIKG